MCTWEVVGPSIEISHGGQLVPAIHFLQRPVTPLQVASPSSFFQIPEMTRADHLTFVRYTMHCSPSAIHSCLESLHTPTSDTHPPSLTAKFYLS